MNLFTIYEIFTSSINPVGKILLPQGDQDISVKEHKNMIEMKLNSAMVTRRYFVEFNIDHKA